MFLFLCISFSFVFFAFSSSFSLLCICIFHRCFVIFIYICLRIVLPNVLVSCFFSLLFPFRCHQSSLRTYAEAGPSLLNRHFYPSPLTVRVSFYTAGDRVLRLLWMAVFPYSVAAFGSVVVPCYSLLARVVRGGFRRLGVPFSFRSIVSAPCSPCCSPSCSPLFLYLILTSPPVRWLLSGRFCI